MKKLYVCLIAFLLLISNAHASVVTPNFGAELTCHIILAEGVEQEWTDCMNESIKSLTINVEKVLRSSTLDHIRTIGERTVKKFCDMEDSTLRSIHTTQYLKYKQAIEEDIMYILNRNSDVSITVVELNDSMPDFLIERLNLIHDICWKFFIRKFNTVREQGCK